MNQTSERHEDADAIWREIQEAVRNIRYGSVQIIVQDGRVIQIERTEKVRFSPSRTRT